MKLFLAAFLVGICFSANLQAQTPLTFESINLQSNGHKLTLQAPTLSGDQTFSFPTVPTGSLLSGFVEQGDVTKPFLQWDATDNYWKAVTSSFGTGVANRLTRWGTASTLDTSILYDDGTRIAINNTAPQSEATFQVTNGTVLFDGTTGITPDLYAGTRMMWLPEKGSFRAGTIDGTQWADPNVGYNSIGVGKNVRASGDYSIALGEDATAPNTNSVSIGHSLLSVGYRSMALGNYASTNYKQGSFVYGDNSTTTSVNNSQTHQFMVRATGGFVFYTSLNGAPTVQGNWIGAELLPGATSWSVISDSNRKENRLHANGEEVLGKISNMWLGSWNYKGQDPKEFRHYGPMAQEFYAAFGNDGVGRSGNDTTITSGDFDGINMIAIQALEKRTAAQTSQIKQQNTRIQELEAQNAELRNELQTIKQAIASIARAQQNTVQEASLK